MEATGSAAAAIDVVALESQTAADVRTGHIANDAASEETNRSSQERTRSRTKRHIVHALSGAGRGRRKHGRHDDGHRKYLFHDESSSRCGTASSLKNSQSATWSKSKGFESLRFRWLCAQGVRSAGDNI